MKFLSALIGFILAVLALCFALANRQTATINLWPLDMAVEAPVYLLSLGTLFVGLMMGAVVAWLYMIPHRLRARRLHKDVILLNDKIHDLQQTVLAPEHAARKPHLPFLTSKSLRRFWEPR
jgi:uncharacterized integral membrane protein